MNIIIRDVVLDRNQLFYHNQLIVVQNNKESTHFVSFGVVSVYVIFGERALNAEMERSGERPKLMSLGDEVCMMIRIELLTCAPLGGGSKFYPPPLPDIRDS